MLRDQEQLAIETREFLHRWGLKAKFVAIACDLTPKILSWFMDFRLALSQNKVNRLTSYIAEYEARNG